MWAALGSGAKSFLGFWEGKLPEVIKKKVQKGCPSSTWWLLCAASASVTALHGVTTSSPACKHLYSLLFPRNGVRVKLNRPSILELLQLFRPLLTVYLFCLTEFERSAGALWRWKCMAGSRVLMGSFAGSWDIEIVTVACLCLGFLRKVGRMVHLQ